MTAVAPVQGLLIPGCQIYKAPRFPLASMLCKAFLPQSLTLQAQKHFCFRFSKVSVMFSVTPVANYVTKVVCVSHLSSLNFTPLMTFLGYVHYVALCSCLDRLISTWMGWHWRSFNLQTQKVPFTGKKKTKIKALLKIVEFGALEIRPGCPTSHFIPNHHFLTLTAFSLNAKYVNLWSLRATVQHFVS